MARKRGFTLIELLVVIAIIALLSSIVLASLSTAKLKAKDSAVKAEMGQMRAEAERGYRLSDNTYMHVIFGNNLGTQTGRLGRFVTSITNKLPPNSVFRATNSPNYALVRPTGWAMLVILNDGSYWCVDSENHSGPSTAIQDIHAVSSNSTDVICDNQ